MHTGQCHEAEEDDCVVVVVVVVVVLSDDKDRVHRKLCRAIDSLGILWPHFGHSITSLPVMESMTLFYVSA